MIQADNGHGVLSHIAIPVTSPAGIDHFDISLPLQLPRRLV